MKLPLAVLGCYWVLLIYQLGAQWSVYEQYHYGWSVPFLCLYLLWRRCQESEGGGQKPEGGGQRAEGGGQRAEGGGQRTEIGGRRSEVGGQREENGDRRAECGGQREYSTSILYLLIALGALLYAATRWLHEANPIWRLTGLLWSLEVIGLTLCFVYIAGGRAWLRRFGFPIAFFLVAVPWPSGLENYVVQSLMRLNSGITVELLGLFGVPAIQHGNVIEISHGMVGIEEACSGIRSVQATLMISLFLGEVCRLRACWRVLLVFGGFLMAFAFNVVRTFLLTWVAAAKGMAAIASWHDPAGVTILVACFVCLWLMAVWLGKKQGAESRKQKTENRKQKTEIGGKKLEVGSQKSDLRPPISDLRSLAIALLAWFVLVEVSVEWWYRAHEKAVAMNGQWMVNATGMGPGFVKVEIPQEVSVQFHSDESLAGRWRGDAGTAWQLYYFRWFPEHSLKKRMAIQLAKTHGPETCLPAIGMTLQSNLGIVTVPVGDRQFAFRHYLFLADGHPLHVFYAIYEDPSGSAVLANRRRDTASRIAAAIAGSRNEGQRYLEIAVSGFENDADATTKLAKVLPALIETRK